MQKVFKPWHKIVLIALLICGLACIRLFEHELFYDPLLAFFKRDNFQKPLPNIDWTLLAINYFFRYSLNTMLSLLIIYVIFNDKKLIWFVIIMFGIFFVTLISIFFGLLSFHDESLNMILFYVRRFIIQPLLLLLFVPAFFYQKKTTEMAQ